tara:strand:+ start:1564 stop:2028 length:465 start_codon:yes stop_codon:yes gene_type:complete
LKDYQKTYQERNTDRINLAEVKAEEYFKKKGVTLVRFGFDEKDPPMQTNEWFKLPEIVRSSPDFIIINKKSAFMEVKGFYQELKIKVHDLIMMNYWNQVMPLYLYCYDNSDQQSYTIKYQDLYDQIHIQPVDRYKDNQKVYYKLTKAILKGVQL